MGKYQIVFLLLATLTVAFLLGISVSIAAGSAVGIIICALCAVGTMGTGFTLKKKKREAEQKN